MTTVFLLLPDIRVVPFTLARNLLHLHMTGSVSDRRICGLLLCAQLGFLDTWRAWLAEPRKLQMPSRILHTAAHASWRRRAYLQSCVGAIRSRSAFRSSRGQI